MIRFVTAIGYFLTSMISITLKNDGQFTLSTIHTEPSLLHDVNHFRKVMLVNSITEQP